VKHIVLDYLISVVASEGPGVILYLSSQWRTVDMSQLTNHNVI